MKPKLTDREVVEWMSRNHWDDLTIERHLDIKCARIAMEDALSLVENDSPWIKASDRMPTKEDADDWGIVAIFSYEGGFNMSSWNTVCGGFYWTPCPKPEKPKPDFQRDYVDKLEGAALELWEMLSVSDRGGVRSIWEARNL